MAGALLNKYGEDFKVLNAVSASLREWSDEMILQPLRQVGFIDDVQYQAIKAKNQLYVPYRRLLDQTNEYLTAHLGAQGVPGKVLKEIKGSEKQVLSPLQTWIELAYKAQWAYARNKVYRAAWLLGQAYQDAGIKEVPAKRVRVDLPQIQQIDAVLRPQLLQLVKDLGVSYEIRQAMRYAFGQFEAGLRKAVDAGEVQPGEVGRIKQLFATTEKVTAHELGHAIDHIYNLVELLIKRGTPQMKRELRAIADQRAGEEDSGYYRRSLLSGRRYLKNTSNT